MSELMYVLLTFSVVLHNVQSQSPTIIRQTKNRKSKIIRQTENGKVKGIKLTSSMGQEYYAFRSVRYAEPPITTGFDNVTGENVDRRFKAPEPLKRIWNHPENVQDFKLSCLESSGILPTKQPVSEDCLYLNIYVPAGGKKKKTILFWIFGGGFTEGGHREALYGPDFLLDEDNIVVAVQYRLGIFGFLNLGIANYTGNMGLKDQQLASKWVYENIESFSGNKDEILLFGEGAGGASVTFHMLNEESRKYFKSALAMSGSVYSYFAFTETNHIKKMRVCTDVTDVNHIVKQLRVLDISDIIKCQFANNWGRTLKPEWVPTIERKGTVNGFLTELPNAIWTSSKDPVVDSMFTMTSEEQVTFDPEMITRPTPLITPKCNSSILLPFEELTRRNYPTHRHALVKLRKAYYSGATDVKIISRENIALMSDLNFNDSILKALKRQAAVNCKEKNTYLLRFAVNDELNWIKILYNSSHEGTAHEEELCYIFHCHMLDKDKVYDKILSDPNSISHKLIRRMVKTITNFARSGDPSIKGDTPYKRIVSSDEICCQEIKNHPKTTVTTYIDQELHYDTWRDIEKMYKHVIHYDTWRETDIKHEQLHNHLIEVSML